MKTPIVWVAQEGNNNYAPAEQFGEVRFITKGDLRSMTTCQQNSDVAHDIRKFYSEYIVGHDFIVPGGNPMVTILLSMGLNAGNHKFLKWDGRRAVYIPFTLNSDNIWKSGQ